MLGVVFFVDGTFYSLLVIIDAAPACCCCCQGDRSHPICDDVGTDSGRSRLGSHKNTERLNGSELLAMVATHVRIRWLRYNNSGLLVIVMQVLFFLVLVASDLAVLVVVGLVIADCRGGEC